MTEKEFFEAFDLGTPVLIKWIYDGYYEDYDWKVYEENCSDILCKRRLTIEELNEKIQQYKGSLINKRIKGYHPEIDAVDTAIGVVSGAYMKYPELTNVKLLNLAFLLNKRGSLSLPRYKTLENFKCGILRRCTNFKYVPEFRKDIKELFND